MVEPSSHAQKGGKKHAKLNKDKDGVVDVEIKQLVRKVRNKLDSPFISQ